MASKLTVEFQFEIGDIVYIKTADNDAGHTPRKFIIIERIVEQCHADMQLLLVRCLYRLHGIEGLVHEIVLTAEMPPFKPTSKDECVDRAIRNIVDRRYASLLRSDEDEDWSSIEDIRSDLMKEI